MEVMELRIKELCEKNKKNKMTLSELAKRAGIARETLSREKWNPSLKTLEGIAKVLDVDVSELFQKPAKDIDSSLIIGSVRVGDRIHAIDSIQDVERLLGELKGGQQ